MVKSTLNAAIIILSSLLILACNVQKQVDLDMEVNVSLDGKPASQARVFLDGNEIGSTDANGRFLHRIKKQPGEEVRVSVHKGAVGYRIEPWEDSFVIKLAQKGAVEKYPFKVELKAIKYFTVVVLDDEDGELLEGASIRFAGKSAGKTDESGEYVHEYTRIPKKGLKLHIAKKGYAEWKKSVRVKPGQRYEVALNKKRKPAVAKKQPAPKKATKSQPAKTVTKSQKKKAALAAVPKTKKKTAKPKMKKATIAYRSPLSMTNFACCS